MKEEYATRKWMDEYFFEETNDMTWYLVRKMCQFSKIQFEKTLHAKTCCQIQYISRNTL